MCLLLKKESCCNVLIAFFVLDKQFSHKKFLYTSIRLNLRMEQVFPAAHLNTTPQFGPNRRSSDYIIRLSSDLNLQCYAVIPTS